jgi:hypothetical protein
VVGKRNLQPSLLGIAKRSREIARARSNKHIYLLNTLRARALRGARGRLGDSSFKKFNERSAASIE